MTVTAPVIDVYQEALDFYRSRKVISDSKKYFSKEMDAMRPRAFWAAGLQKHATAVAMNRAIEQTIAGNLSDAEAFDRLADALEAHEGTLLPASRIRVIFHNAMTTARASGTWRQSMAYVEDRPWFRYIGPPDGPRHHISNICRPMRGRIVHHTSAVLKTFWPPNHHLEASEWESLSDDQVDEKMVYAGADGEKYPVIDGRVLRPGDGWEFDPADAMAADERIFVASAADLTEKLAAKTAADYKLPALADVDDDVIPRAPKLGQAVTSAKGAIEKGWRRLAKDVGIENDSGAWLLDYGMDAVRVNRDSFEKMLTDEEGVFAGTNARLFPLVRPTLAEPFETWFVPFLGPDGEPVYVKRYVGVYRSGKERVTVVIDRTDNGWLWRLVEPIDVEDLREGLLVNSKAGNR